jgi:hypothetical protein
MKTRWWSLLFLSLLVAALAASAAAQSVASAQSSQAKAQMAGLIPDPLPAQAVSQGTPEFYHPDDLYKYMDGGADVFLFYDFKELLHQEFKAKQADLTVDVFDMGTPLNAFGIYAAERAPLYHFIPVGTEGYQNEGILNFLQGRYYVKLTAFGDGADSVLDQFAHSLSAKMGDNGAFPELVQKMPQNHLIPRSEQYWPKAPLGHEFLSPGYMATYSLDNQNSMLLISVAANEQEAQQRMKTLDEHFRKTGQCAPAPELGEGAIRASNSYEGKLIARTKGRYVILLFNPVAGAPEVLKEAMERLQ